MTPPFPDSRAIHQAAETLMARCDALARCTDQPGCVNRPYLSPATRDAHALVSEWMRAAGLQVRVDAAGNIIGRREPEPAPGSPAFLIGSHLDTVPNAGRYDGILGVMAGLSVAELLRETPLPFELQVVGFSEEEGVRYQRPYLGSMALAGCFDPALLEHLDSGGIPLRQAITDFGLDPSRIVTAALAPDRVIGYAELHIEQGPVLEDLDLPVGVVETIIGQERLVLSLRGTAGHAGTVPMDRRRDAAVGLARIILAVQEHGRTIPALRATVGSVQISPNVRNVIPGEARFSLDVRHADDAVRQRAVCDILARATHIAHTDGLTLDVLQHDAERSVPMDPALALQLEDAVRASGRPIHRMVSGAGHDAAIMAPRFPSAMLFVRNAGGISHHPDESVDIEDVGVALEVLTRFITALQPSANLPLPPTSARLTSP